jgi:hypothetical protein
MVTIMLPGEACAWGPMTHLAHGSDVLGNLTILGVALQQLLRRHRLEYLYGCIGADITQAKRYTRAQQAHCHSWGVGWALLQHARSEAERAFAYGYLTHLAGDVYSHNHYVPTQLIVSFRARTLGHIYWEARFDTLQPERHRQIIHALRSRQFPDCDAMIRTVVSRTLLPFRADKRIFDSFIAVHDLEQWHRIIRGLAAASRYALRPDVVARYNTACASSIMDLLQRGKRSACQHVDPTGVEALSLARQVRATLRALARRGQIPPRLQQEIDGLNDRADLGAPLSLAPARLSVAR